MLWNSKKVEKLRTHAEIDCDLSAVSSLRIAAQIDPYPHRFSYAATTSCYTHKIDRSRGNWFGFSFYSMLLSGSMSFCKFLRSKSVVNSCDFAVWRLTTARSISRRSSLRCIPWQEPRQSWVQSQLPVSYWPPALWAPPSRVMWEFTWVKMLGLLGFR